MTLENGQRVHLTLSDWLRLATFAALVLGALAGIWLRQETLLRELLQRQTLTEYRLERLEERVQ